MQQPCIVVGGGKVAERKVRMLLQFNASITLISPDVTPLLHRLAEKRRITLVKRAYRKGDLKKALLVFAATNNTAINHNVKRDASELRIPVNVADNPELCDFIVPSIIKKGPIVIAISTSATLPLLSKKLRKEIEALIRDTHIAYAKNIGRFRKLLIQTIRDENTRKRIMKRIEKMDMRDVASKKIPELYKLILHHTP